MEKVLSGCNATTLARRDRGRWAVGVVGGAGLHAVGAVEVGESQV